MARPRAGVKYGAADSVEIFTCPDNHIHLVGKDEQGIREYEIVLGAKHFDQIENALHKVRW